MGVLWSVHIALVCFCLLKSEFFAIGACTRPAYRLFLVCNYTVLSNRASHADVQVAFDDAAVEGKLQAPGVAGLSILCDGLLFGGHQQSDVEA